MIDLHALEGLSPDNVYDNLYRLAMNVPSDLAIVEIGGYLGKGAAFLATGSKHGNGAPVHVIDPWDLPGERHPTGVGRSHGMNYAAPGLMEKARAQLKQARVLGRVTMIRGFSVDVAHNWAGPKVGLLHLDGDHRAPAVRQDFAAWEPHLAPGATVTFDDHEPTRFPGVCALVSQLVEKDLISLDTIDGTLAIGRYRP